MESKQERVDFVEFIKFIHCPNTKEWFEIYHIKSNEEKEDERQPEVCDC